MQAAELVQTLASNLQGKGYTQIAGPSVNSFAMFKQATGFGVPKLVAIVANTDMPNTNFTRADPWFKKIMGRSGAGLLLLVLSNPQQNYVSDALKQGHGVLGYGQVVCGVYDLSQNTYYLPKGAVDTYHMGWDQELFT